MCQIFIKSPGGGEGWVQIFYSENYTTLTVGHGLGVTGPPNLGRGRAGLGPRRGEWESFLGRVWRGSWGQEACSSPVPVLSDVLCRLVLFLFFFFFFKWD